MTHGQILHCSGCPRAVQRTHTNRGCNQRRARWHPPTPRAAEGGREMVLLPCPTVSSPPRCPLLPSRIGRIPTHAPRGRRAAPTPAAPVPQRLLPRLAPEPARAIIAEISRETPDSAIVGRLTAVRHPFLNLLLRLWRCASAGRGVEGVRLFGQGPLAQILQQPPLHRRDLTSTDVCIETAVVTHQCVVHQQSQCTVAQRLRGPAWCACGRGYRSCAPSRPRPSP